MAKYLSLTKEQMVDYVDTLPDNGWITGRVAITKFCAKYFGFSTWHTVLGWQRSYNFPLHRLPNNQPFIIAGEIFLWALNYDRLKQQYEKESPEVRVWQKSILNLNRRKLPDDEEEEVSSALDESKE